MKEMIGLMAYENAIRNFEEADKEISNDMKDFKFCIAIESICTSFKNEYDPAVDKLKSVLVSKQCSELVWRNCFEKAEEKDETSQMLFKQLCEAASKGNKVARNTLGKVANNENPFRSEAQEAMDATKSQKFRQQNLNEKRSTKTSSCSIM